jgi:fucose permease
VAGRTAPLSGTRRLSVVVQLSSFVLVIGVTDGMVGVLWPSMRLTFNAPLDGLGVLAIAGTVLYFAGGLAAHRLDAKLGGVNLIALACALALVALIVWAAAWGFAVLLVGVALVGLAKGVLDASINGEAALDGGVRRLGLLHGCWAIGGTLGPVMVAAVLAELHDWRAAVGVAAGGVFLVSCVALGLAAAGRPRETAHSRPRAASGEPDVTGRADDVGPRDGRPVAGRRRLPFVLTICAFVTYTAAETGPISWGYTYLVFDRRLAATAAALAIAAFWGSLTAGRFSLAALGHRFAGVRILEWSCAALLVGTGLFWVLPGAYAVIGLPVAGLGAACIFPVLVALTPHRLGMEVTGRAVGASVAGAAVGGPFAVALFGVLAAHFGVRVLGVCLFAASGAMVVVNRLLSALAGPGAAGPAVGPGPGSVAGAGAGSVAA